MIFHQLFEQDSSTCTYLLGCAGTAQAILVDPVAETIERDLAVLGSLGRYPPTKICTAQAATFTAVVYSRHTIVGPEAGLPPRSHRDDDLAQLLVRFHVAVGVDDGVEREGPVDQRL